MIRLSCGHTVSDIEHGYDVITKSSDRDGEKAVSYSIVCGPCEDGYRQAGYLFDTYEQSMEWASKEDW